MKITGVILAVLAMSVLVSTQGMAKDISIVGTGSGSSVIKSIAKAYRQINPDVTIRVPKSIGSGGGIKAVGTGQNILGRVAREIKEKEKSYMLSYLPYAKNPIVLFVNKNVGITNLMPQEICDIYSGKITNWKEVGGKDSRIRVIRREDGDSSLEVLQKLMPGFADITLTEKSKTTFSDPDTCELAEKKPKTIAFGTYANSRNYDVDILSIGDKKVLSSGYPYLGTLAFIFKKNQMNQDIKKFVTFATSKGAHNAIKNAGAVPF